MYPDTPIRADPRLGNLRPGWLADDGSWRDHLDVLADQDVTWIERQWDMAGGRSPRLDTSWLKLDRIR